MIIMTNALKEKIRRKELYIVAALGLLILVLFSSGAGTLTINGEPITGYKNMAPVLITVVNVVSGALAIALSIRTIPNEYERKTSHLIWIRGVSQPQYHGELALANIISSLLAAAIMYTGIVIFSVVKGEMDGLIRLLPAFLILSISIAIISLLTSLLSIVFPGMVTGVIVTVCYLVGILHGMLDIIRGMISGFSSTLLKGLLFVIPDLNQIQAQAGNIISGETVSVHVILKGLLIIYILTIFLFVFKKKEGKHD